MKKVFLGTASLVLILTARVSLAQEFIIIQSTTSTKNSGLYDYILPTYEEQSGVQVRVVAVGTGQAIKNAQKCDGDVLWVHAKDAEENFVKNGFGVTRQDVMYNDFILVGPANDPAELKGGDDIVAALQSIAEKNARFASRGDDSGTHKKELNLWQLSDINPNESSGAWYSETGSGMGTTLNVGVGINAYVLTDRATWINFGNKAGHSIVVEGDDKLFNQYGITLVDVNNCPNVKADKAQHFIDWVTGEQGQALIGTYEIEGQQLFFPNAQP